MGYTSDHGYVDDEEPRREPFEIVDQFGSVVYMSSDPPDTCGGSYDGPCGGCDDCAAARAGPGAVTRPVSLWTPWPGWNACKRCGAGRVLCDRCERCNEGLGRYGGGVSWSTDDPDQMAAALMFTRAADSPSEHLTRAYVSEGFE